MIPAYVRVLEQEREAATGAADVIRPNLRQSFLEWYGNLPAVSRDRPFAMAEMEQAVGTQGKYLSVVLLSLGWRRKRKWTGGGHYSRFWVPPTC